MSLMSAMQMASNALQAQQIGLQVVGQNMANVNTPGYSREEVIFSPAPTQRYGGLLLGMGVQVQAVVQKIDTFLEERLRNSTSDRASSEAQEQAFMQLEALIGELSDTDLSTSMNNFFSAISEVLNQPESVATRNLAALKGKTLADDIRRLSSRVDTIRTDVNDRVIGMASDVDRLLEEIRTLNVRITSTEGGDTTKSDAVGLRDQRNLALTKLAELIDIQVQEQPSGATNVFNGGDFLVFEGTRRHVEARVDPAPGLSPATVRIVETDSALRATSGELAGLYVARDEALGGFSDQLTEFSRTMAFEFNKVFSSGQGLKGYSTLTSERAVGNVDLALDAAGLDFTPVNGSFQVQIYNKQTKLTTTTEIRIDLNGLDDNDTTLTSLAAALEGIDGISASITAGKQLKLDSDSSNLEIAFGNDTSGTLAALGLNTFFTGGSARDIGVNSAIMGDPARFAASKTGIGGDTSNAIELAAFLDRPLDSRNGASISDAYDQLTGETTQASAVSRAVADGFRVFDETLRGQQLATSGVSLDEEAVRMISYQRAFQASARYISTVSELLEILVNL